MKIESGGDTGDRIEGYKLPITDTQVAKRNFPGYEKKQWYNLEELRTGDLSGTTDTDLGTDNKKDGPDPKQTRSYSKINQKGRPKMRPYKASSQHKAEN